MEEERLEIEALLQQQEPSSFRGPPSINGLRSSSPYMSPRSPVRSMLDVGDSGSVSSNNGVKIGTPPAPFRSMLDIDTPPPAPVRSMLDITSPPSSVSKSKPPMTSSAQTSPTLATHRVVPVAGKEVHHRSMSDATTKPVLDFGGPRSPPLPHERNNDPTSAYRFADIYATNVGQALPPGKRTAQPHPRSSSIGEALRGADLSNLVLPGDRGKSFSMKGNNKSKSPNNRFSLRSHSPHGTLLSSSARNQQPAGSILLDNGQVFDMNNAYRRLSDANLLYGGSNLASYTKKKIEPDGHGRLEKSNMSPYGEILTDDDSDEDVVNSSDEEDHRGRKLTTRAESHGDGSRAAKSLLAAAEDERRFSSRQPISPCCGRY